MSDFEVVKTIEWRNVERQRFRFYRLAAKTVGNLFAKEGAAVVAHYREHHRYDPLVIDQFRSDWVVAFRNIWRTVIAHFGGWISSDRTQIGSQKGRKASEDEWPFRPWTRAIQNAVDAFIGQHITYVTDATKRKVAKIVGDATLQQLGPEAVADKIQALYDGFTPERAMRIARTEVVSATNYGILEAARQAPFPLLKQWLSMRDERVRDSHASIDGETIELEELFSNGLLFPGDPSGPAREVVNCRCVLRLIRKIRRRGVRWVQDVFSRSYNTGRAKSPDNDPASHSRRRRIRTRECCLV